MLSILRIVNRGSERSVRLKKNIIGSFLLKGISILITFLLVPLTLGYVSEDIYGIWLTLSSIIVWIGFLDIGFTLGLKNKLAEALANNDYERGRKLITTSYCMVCFIFVPILIVLQILIPYVCWSDFLNVPIEYEQDIINCLKVLSVAFCLQMIFQVITSVIAAHQHTALSSVFPVIANFISLFVILIMSHITPPSLEKLAYALSLTPLVLLSSSIFLFSSRYKHLSPAFKCFDISEIRSLFSLGAKFFIIQIQVVVFFQATNILISNIGGPADVTQYNIAYKYLNTAEMIMTMIVSPLWPAFTDAYTRRDYTWMRNVYNKIQKIAFAVILLLIVMTIFAPWAYSIWIGDKTTIPFLMTFVVMCNMILTTINSVDIYIINGVGSIKIQTLITLLGLIFHIPLSFLYGSFFGSIGVIMSMITFRLIYTPVFHIQVYKILNQTNYGIWGK